MQETQDTWVPSLCRDDPMEEETATTPVTLPGKSPRQRRLAGCSPGGHRAGCDWVDKRHHCHCSVSKLCPTLGNCTDGSTPSYPPLPFTISLSLLKIMSTELVVLYNHLILCHPILCLPLVFPSIRILLNELAFHIRWPKY